MTSSQQNSQCGASPRKRVPVIRSLHAPGIRTWAVTKKRTKSSALAAAAHLALPSSGSRHSARDTSAGSSHNEEPRGQGSDAGQGQLKCYYRRRGKVYTRRKFQQPCVPTAAAAIAAATSILPENNREVNCESGDQDTTTTTTTVVEKSEESAPSSASPKAWKGQHSTKRKRDVPRPPVLDGVAGTIRKKDGTKGNDPEAEAAAAADVGRPQRQRIPKVFKDYVNTSTARYEWITYYPGVPYPEDYEQALDSVEQLGEVEAITTVSEGGPSDISDSADKPFSLKLQTDIQKTRKARRILVEDSLFHSVTRRRLHVPQRNDYTPPAAVATPPPLPKESSSSMCPQTPDKLQESNGECEVGDQTPATPSESAAAAASDDDKDSSWTASDDDSTRSARTRFHEERLTFEFEISGHTPKGSRLLQNGFPESVTVKAKVKLKKKRPRPKVWRPEKVKVAKPVKIPKTYKRKQHRPARGAFEHNNNAKRAAAAAVREHSLRATASAEFVEPASGRKTPSSKRQRQNERSKPSSKAADSASVPTAAEVADISIAAEAVDNSMAMGNDRRTMTVDLTSAMVPTMENRGPASEQRAEYSSALEQELLLLDPGASVLTMEKTTSESDLQHRSYLDVYRCMPNFGGAPVPKGCDWMEEPPSTPRGNTLAVLPASIPFLNSPSFAPNENFLGGWDSSDSDGEQTIPTPTRRKRSSRTQRTRRSLLSAVELAGAAAGNDNSVAAPLCVSPPVLRPAIPFFKMTEEHKRQHALALCQDPRFFEDPMGLVVELIRGTPKHLLPTLCAQTNRLVIGILKSSGDGAPVDNTANQLVCPEPSPASSFPLPIQSRESDAQEPLQLVVYARKSSDMVVYQEIRPKVKYKPKVYLDPLTINTFERLMLQGGEVKDTEHADEDWVAARKLWSDRAHHFNGIMHQVQGDRAFSKWGGSVLDSVVGAFLTQNVSDFLSSNAFMALRAHFPARQDARTGTDVPTEEQSSLTEEITPGGCSGGTSADIGLGTPSMAGEHVPVEGSKELVDAVGIDNQQENAAPMPDAGIQDGQVVTEVSMKHTRVTTFLAESQETTITIVNSLSRDEAQRDPDQSDPYSLSGDDRSAETLESSFDINDLVIGLGAAHLGSTSVALGSCSSMEMTGTRAGIPDEPVSANVYDETPRVIETTSEVPRVASTVQGSPSKAYHSGTQAATADDGEKGIHSDMGAQRGKASSSKNLSMLEDKFRRSLEEDTSTPEGTEKVLAAALRAILGKQTTGREEAGKGQRVPLKPLKRKQPRNNRYVDINRFKTNVRLLSGGERANYELKVNYKLNSEQKVTWEALRADVLSNKEFGRDPFTADSVDWEAVRRADVAELANVIKERGMNNILGGRIKSLLDRTHRDQDGSLDLEWVRKLSPINAQNFLTSVRGLGIKSVECIRLLTLHHPSFPVDTNVGRIVVRLGWVPLEPLPEETQLHLLEMYPVQEHIQKYIWPRLCTLDQQTLYEFHYQLITFGKVFCTKSKPNCNACPMRSQCKHYESAYCSARPLLKGPEEPSNDSEHQIAPLMSRPSMQTPLEERQSFLMLEGNARTSGGACIPIIEEPNSPEYVPDIEEIPFTNVDTDYVELPDVNLEFEPSACGGRVVYVELNETSTQNVSEESSMEIPIKGAGQESEGCIEDVVEESNSQVLGEEVAHTPSLELVLLPPEAASFPAPPLKNVQRLRTIHYVYELPDHHPLLSKMDRRDPEDPCFYLLAIWNSDEVPESMPKISDDDASNPFACCQSGDESVWGTLLVPCRTAMKGSFPLNGTYFQVNEVFADHGSSIVPIDVPRTLLWNLKRRFVYFGTSVTSIFKDMSQEEIQCCFKKGYICVRALDQATRQPKLLAARLHQSGARIVAARAVGPKGRRASKSKVAS